MNKIILTTATLALFALVSCSKDEDVITAPTNTVTAPTTYEFTRDNKSTVDFSGQTTRIKMATELIGAMKDNTKTTDELQAMFSHEAGKNNFSDADLNASSKNIRSKVAASLDFYSTNSTEANAIRQTLDGWIEKQATEVFANWTQQAEEGKAGNIQQLSGTTRYVNAKGFEYNQLVAKSLIGGLMTDQIVNNYLSAAKLDGGNNKENNNNGIAEEGNATTMEHAWDEAYGYLYGAENNPSVPVLGADSFLNEYLEKAEEDNDFKGIAATIYNAFKKGRAAIVAKNYTVRDQQAEIIKANISKVIAIRAVHYLQAGKMTLDTDKASAFHALSEAYGFIYSLQFTRQPNSTLPYFTKTEVEGLLSQLEAGNGLWDVTPTTLDQLSDSISSKFGFTTAQTIN
ncbi:MAG: DUF4856 domain-containing protein [Flavobacteriales bacterium]|nr:DUF4856 domain-containing protein [Flavobacteriales bacterium]